MKGEISLQIMAALLLLIGLFQLLSGVFKLGRVIQFASVPVVVGYILGSAFAISSEQLYTFLGIESNGEQVTLFEKMRYLVMHFQELHPPTALVGVLSLTILLTLKKVKALRSGLFGYDFDCDTACVCLSLTRYSRPHRQNA